MKAQSRSWIQRLIAVGLIALSLSGCSIAYGLFLIQVPAPNPALSSPLEDESTNPGNLLFPPFNNERSGVSAADAEESTQATENE